MAGYDFVNSKDKLCLFDVKLLDPNLHITSMTSSSQMEGHNASCLGTTTPDLSTVTVKLEIGNADGKGYIVANHNEPGPSSSIPSYNGDSDEYKLNTTNTSDSMTIDQRRLISPVRKTVDDKNWIKKEPHSPPDAFSTLNTDSIVIHSKVDDMVSGNVDLENDVAGKPLYSNCTPSMESDWNRVKHEPTEVILADKPSRSKGPTRKENQISDEFSEKVIPRMKGNFVCRICSKKYVYCSAVKTHMIQKHPQCRDHCILVKNYNKDLDSDFKHLWFCPMNCKYLTSQHNALLQHLVTCQKPNVLSYCKSAGNEDIVNNLGPLNFEIDKVHGGDISAEDLMIHTQQTGQGSSILGQALGHGMQTVDQDLKDIPTCKLCGDLVFSTNLLLEDHVKDCHKDQDKSTYLGEKAFKYSHCTGRFFESKNLDVHMRTHPGEKPFKCSHCIKGFSQSSHLREHLRTHTGEKPFKCTHCNKIFSQCGNLREHMRTHTGEKPFKCTHCNKGFSQNGNLREHLRIHTGEKPFKCSHCNKSFSRRGVLCVHMRTHTGEKPFKCSHCNKSFIRRGGLCAHMRTHTGEKPFECSHCNKSFSRRGNLQEHMRVHTGEKPFKCSHCNKSFRYSGYLRVHITTHTGEKPFKCSHCHKSFSYSTHLQVHMRTHTGERPFKCSHCNKRFIRSWDLHCHMRTHSGEKPFKCNDCNKRFIRNCDLRVHMRTHTGEKSFKCSHCNKSFVSSGGLGVHNMRTHIGEKPFKCSHCNKKYFRSFDLRVHMRTHTGEKPFKCSHCNKSFISNGGLSVHMRRHTGEESFKCSHCNKCFRYSGHRREYIRTRTEEKPFKCSHCNELYS